ncbi:unnamed protein product [Brachionus calyciflorus]|uniref:Uncharacterized protein n=1 Tax=Brachionus calyciflorus TaxID=104777 RepID=A0A813XNH2_9BILA|nr:unnamed protein product [Brachionus calyciflorus]
MVTVMKPKSLREAKELAQLYTSSLGNTEKVNYLKTKGNFGKLIKMALRKIMTEENGRIIGHVKANCRLKKTFHRVKVIEDIDRGEPETLRNITTRNIENVNLCSFCKIMKVIGTIKNNWVFYALDSGASRSVVAYKIVRKFNFKINPTNIQVKVLDNTINNAIGETDTQIICFVNSIIYQKFLIMDLDDNDVLLGLDWFLKSGATLTPVNKSFKKERILKEIGAFPASKNDAKIIKMCFSQDKDLENLLRKGDVILLDRGFRDSIQYLENKELRAMMPAFIAKERKQYLDEIPKPESFLSSINPNCFNDSSDEANDKGETQTQNESQKKRKNLQKKLKKNRTVFGTNLNNYSNPNISSSNMTSKPNVLSTVQSPKPSTDKDYKIIMESIKISLVLPPQLSYENIKLKKVRDAKQIPNGRVYRVQKENVIRILNQFGTKSKNIIKPNDYVCDSCISSCESKSNKLKEVYDSLNLDQELNTSDLNPNEINQEIDDDDGKKAIKKNSIFIQYDPKIENDNAIDECRNGARTVGCPSHISSLIYYLSIGRYSQNLKIPGKDLEKIFSMPCTLESSDNSEDEENILNDKSSNEKCLEPFENT